VAAEVLLALKGTMQGAAAGAGELKGFQGQRDYGFIYPTCLCTVQFQLLHSSQ